MVTAELTPSRLERGTNDSVWRYRWAVMKPSAALGFHAIVSSILTKIDYVAATGLALEITRMNNSAPLPRERRIGWEKQDQLIYHTGEGFVSPEAFPRPPCEHTPFKQTSRLGKQTERVTFLLPLKHITATLAA